MVLLCPRCDRSSRQLITYLPKQRATPRRRARGERANNAKWPERNHHDEQCIRNTQGVRGFDTNAHVGKLMQELGLLPEDTGRPITIVCEDPIGVSRSVDNSRYGSHGAAD